MQNIKLLFFFLTKCGFDLLSLDLQARQVRNLHRSAVRAGAGGIFVVSYSCKRCNNGTTTKATAFRNRFISVASIELFVVLPLCRAALRNWLVLHFVFHLFHK